MQNKYIPEATRAAKMIRTELKTAFPTIKFSVRTSYFAGGDAVDISYTNGVPSSEVEAVVKKYQDGSFNGMEDIYEYSKNPQNLPRSKWVMVSRHIDQTIKDAKKLEVAKSYGIENPNDETEWMKKTNSWSDQKIWKSLEQARF